MKAKYIYLVLFVAFGACKKDEVKLVEDSSSIYTPLALDYEWTYAVDSIVYNGDVGRPIDTFQYYIKRKVVDTFTNNQRDLVHTIYQYYRTDTSSSWKYQYSLTEIIDDLALIRNLRDVPEVILSFPIAPFKEWDSNIFNVRDRSESYYESVHESRQHNGQSYDSTVSVMREYAVFFTTSQFVRDVYATHIGLISSEVENIFRLEKNNPREYFGSKYTLNLIGYEN